MIREIHDHDIHWNHVRPSRSLALSIERHPSSFARVIRLQRRCCTRLSRGHTHRQQVASRFPTEHRSYSSICSSRLFGTRTLGRRIRTIRVSSARCASNCSSFHMRLSHGPGQFSFRNQGFFLYSESRHYVTGILPEIWTKTGERVGCGRRPQCHNTTSNLNENSVQ